MKATLEKITWVENAGKTLAYVDICFDDMVITKGWKIMDSDKGRFLAAPSRKGKDEKWYADIYFRSREIADGFKDHILGLADRGRDEQTERNWTGQGEGQPAPGPESVEDPGFDKLKPSAAKCKSCGADIVWMMTQKGKKMPVDAETVPEGYDGLYDPAVMESHFMSCPNADKHGREER